MNAKINNNCHKKTGRKSENTLKAYENNAKSSRIISYAIYTQR